MSNSAIVGPSDNTAYLSGPLLRDAEFQAFRELIYQVAGISLAPVKRQLLASRLARRLRHFNHKSYSEYYEYLTKNDPTGDELQRMVNCITTNKTDFFREPHHFQFLRDVAIPLWKARAERGGSRRVRVWSAGCSTGPEPYSIAIVLLEHLAPAGFEVEVIASDIDTEVLAKAKDGVYPLAEVSPVPPAWLKKYFLRGVGPWEGTVRVHPDVRGRVSFRRVNLIDPPWDVRPGLNAIFCRNVVIYFDRATQQRLFDRYADHLSPDGYLFVGHAENLHGVTDRFAPLGGTVYRPVATGRPVADAPPSVAPPEEKVSIIAGDVFASREPAMVKTLLGSCVSACLFDPTTGVGGMNHFLLPGGGPGDPACARFGVHAMEVLINKIMALGGNRRKLQAKVFGAGSVLPDPILASSVSERNKRFILTFLETERIPIVGHLMGGNTGLRVHFRTDTGQAWVKPLGDSQSRMVAADERRYEGKVAREITLPRTDAITIF